MKRIFLIVIAVFAFCSFDSLQAKSKIHLSEILDSVRKFHPEVMIQIQRLEQAKERLRENQGAFDTKLKLEGSLATDDTYSGDYYKAFIEQALPWSGINVFGGYRQSLGSFPSYEGELETLDAGEFFAGLEWSFMQAFATDPRRLRIIQNRLKSKIEEERIRERVLYLQSIAAKTYFSWRNTIQVQKVYENMYDLALKRQKALEARVSSGDLPQVYLLENQRYILERRRMLYKSEQNKDNSKIYLRLFMRNSKGNIDSSIFLNALPSDEGANFNLIDFLNEDKLLPKVPSLRVVTLQKDIVQRELRNQRANRLPDLKLRSVFKQDIGSGSESLRGPEMDFFGTLEFPLQNRKANASLNIAKAKMKELLYEYQFKEDKVRVKLKQLENTIGQTQKITKNLEEEVSIAKKMVEAEKTKWRNGDSDFVLVNLREQDAAKSEVEYMNTRLALEKMWSDWMYLSTGFESFIQLSSK